MILSIESVKNFTLANDQIKGILMNLNWYLWRHEIQASLRRICGAMDLFWLYTFSNRMMFFYKFHDAKAIAAFMNVSENQPDT